MMWTIKYQTDLINCLKRFYKGKYPGGKSWNKHSKPLGGDKEDLKSHAIMYFSQGTYFREYDNISVVTRHTVILPVSTLVTVKQHITQAK